MTLDEIEKMLEGKPELRCVKDGEGGWVLTTDEGEAKDISYSSDNYSPEWLLEIFSMLAAAPQIIRTLLDRLKIAERALEEIYNIDTKYLIEDSSEKILRMMIEDVYIISNNALSKIRGEEEVGSE